MSRKFLVLGVTSLVFFFASATTFASLGIVAFAMLGELRWSEAAAGGSFLALGLACCASALAPVFLISRIGARWTMAGGVAVLACAFLLAGMSRDLTSFYAAAGLLGVGFSLVANTCGIYLISGWFAEHAPRMIGFYMMAGALGNAVGPPVAEALIAGGGGWRGYWFAMMGTAVLLTVIAAAVLRDTPVIETVSADGAEEDRPVREVLRSSQFAIIALAMVATQTCLLTVASVAAPHLVRLGGTSSFAANILGLQALVGAVATGAAGWLIQGSEPKHMLAAGLLTEAAGVLLLALTGPGWATDLFALLFGIGWAVACLAITVLLIRYFGTRVGTTALSTIWMLLGIAAAGPSAAGLVADRTGSFADALAALALLLVPVAVASFVMAAPSDARPARLAVATVED